MSLVTRRSGAGRSGRGQALVEFALVLPILLLVLLGIVDFGRVVYAYHTIGNAAREAARLAIVDQTSTAVAGRAQARAVGLDITVSATYWRPLPNANPTANAACSPVERECIAVVTVQSDFNAATPIIAAIIGTIELEAVSEMPVEHASGP